MRRCRPSGSCNVAGARLHKPYRMTTDLAGMMSFPPLRAYRAISYGLVESADGSSGRPAWESRPAGFYDTSCSLRAHNACLTGGTSPAASRFPPPTGSVRFPLLPPCPST